MAAAKPEIDISRRNLPSNKIFMCHISACSITSNWWMTKPIWCIEMQHRSTNMAAKPGKEISWSTDNIDGGFQWRFRHFRAPSVQRHHHLNRCVMPYTESTYVAGWKPEMVLCLTTEVLYLTLRCRIRVSDYTAINVTLIIIPKSVEIVIGIA